MLCKPICGWDNLNGKGVKRDGFGLRERNDGQVLAIELLGTLHQTVDFPFAGLLIG